MTVSMYLMPVHDLSACVFVAAALQAEPNSTTQGLFYPLQEAQGSTGPPNRGHLRGALRMLTAFGLARRTGERWSLTDEGQRFIAARSYPLTSIEREQAEIVRASLLSSGSRVLLSSLATALVLADDDGADDPVAALALKLASEADWTPETAAHQTRRYIDVLDELQLLSFPALPTGRAEDFIAQAGSVLDQPPAAPAPDDEIHLVLKWSERHGARTIEDHLEVVRSRGQAWWAVIGRQDRRKLAPRWRALLEQQLAAGVPTYAYISGPTCWRTEILDFTDDEADVDFELAGVKGDDEYSLWVKLADFHPIERAWLTEHLDLAASGGAPVTDGSLGNQTNPMIVRHAGPRRARTRRVWWANQGANFDVESRLGILWAPKTGRDGSVHEDWRALEDATIGDLVLHGDGREIHAVSEVSDVAVDAPHPEHLKGGDGWLVPTSYRELPAPLPLEQIDVKARREEGGPFDEAGDVLPGYFFPLSDLFVNALAREHPQLGLQAAGETALLAYVPPQLAAIETDLHSAGLRLDGRTIRRYHLSLDTRGFVILAGISGGGKTWLAEAYARAIGAVSLVVPVAPNWTSNEDLIGFAPAMGGDYRHTAFSRFLQQAAAEHADATADEREPRPYHLILDEMNLARVEYYFAKFLSAMEQRSRDGSATIFLSENLSVSLTPNLKFIGTVNVDETTLSFADKVYDRAQLIEIEVDRDLFEDHLSGEPHGAALLAVWDAVRPVAPFAFRVAQDIRLYVAEAVKLGVPWEEAFDDQLVQKVLPKLRGTDPKLETALKDVLAVTAGRFPLSAKKVQAMVEEYEVDGLVPNL